MISLRKNILLINLKIQSAFNKFFDQPSYTIDVHTYADVLFYVNSMHPRFARYLSQQEISGEANEGYAFLTKDLKMINNEELYMTKAKEDDIIHLVPAIIGGGGKRGGLFAFLAVFALVAFTGGLGAIGLGAGGAAGAGAAGAGAGAAGGGFFGGVFNAFKALPGFVKSLVTNVALSVVARAFQRQPTPTATTGGTDEAVRENGMFGSLTNSTTSGTPISLHYGMPRVSGQFLSGYIESTEHGKSEIVKVGDNF